ncbi:MAG: tRNA (N(6)-L-threonylcarbamoyladenosine(37)-C(2))-methylthiotransferase MtaB [Eubacteriales bacterium]|nr:tRNA (N(6)-L-threonylcarbamoyladenosine(37)-C(2))-methylthiotransferase MtaB [Eubacteriales bacterium]
MKKVALHNLGCKVNAYEIEAMQQLLEQAGYEIVPFEPGADVYIINTCTVTNIADRKSRQMLHKAKKMNPEAIVVATGCYVQTGTTNLDEDACVDLIIGNNQKKSIVEALRELDADPEPLSHVIDINHTKEYEELTIEKTSEHVRAYIKVQDGCNQFCTYCIIPFARGRVRSRRMNSILEEIQKLAKAGYKEVVLTGIHLSSYGTDFTEENETLLTLIEKVHEIDGIERIRLGSLEPRIVTKEFAERISKLPKMCPHFHLSLQSGCDETLKRMNRKYDSTEYRECCAILRKYFDLPALTTDVIVGFPQESEEEFEKSYKFVDEINFYETHIFKYSMRQGTKAAAMSGQITDAVKSARSDKMLELHERHATSYEQSMMGKELKVLLEESIVVDEKEYYIGHSCEYVKVAIAQKEQYKVNDIVCVKPTSFLKPHLLFGEAVGI